MSSIERAIERSSLGTSQAKAQRRRVSADSAARIVAASQAPTSARKVTWGVTARPAPTRKRGGSTTT